MKIHITRKQVLVRNVKIGISITSRELVVNLTEPNNTKIVNIRIKKAITVSFVKRILQW